jgi:hypothetical protein
MYFNIIRQLMPRSPEWPLPFSFASEILYAVLISDVCYIAPFSQNSIYGNPNNMYQSVGTMKLLAVHIHSVCYCLGLKSSVLISTST